MGNPSIEDDCHEKRKKKKNSTKLKMTRFDMLQNKILCDCVIDCELTRRNEWLVGDQKNNVKSPAQKNEYI